MLDPLPLTGEPRERKLTFVPLEQGPGEDVVRVVGETFNLEKAGDLALYVMLSGI